jgi:hypothetical protein
MKKHSKFIWGFVAGTLLGGFVVNFAKSLLGKV